MNKELCSILRNKLLGLPFIDLAAGMVQTLTTTDLDEQNVTKITKRQPVSYDVVGGGSCAGTEVSMIPDSSRKSILYFEDLGVVATGRIHQQTAFNSTIRLVLWMNRANLVGGPYVEISGRVMATIIDLITGLSPQNIYPFSRLTIAVQRITPQDAAIFLKYTYSEADRQYLRPPFEFFAIDFSCKYTIPARCLSGINWNLQTCS